jgi:predicted GIY-YIG superfamily endonuclease
VLTGKERRAEAVKALRVRNLVKVVECHQLSEALTEGHYLGKMMKVKKKRLVVLRN